jgi:diguanylate cyclase (GGDEF)-like protein
MKWKILQRRAWRWIVFSLAIIVCPSSWAAAIKPILLEASRSPIVASARQIIGGELDSTFVAVGPDRTTIFERSKTAIWWKVSFPDGVDADGEPQLLLEAPYLTWLDAWVPGRATPSRHAIYGEHIDWRYSPRALVIPLPDGIAKGGAVYLLLREPASVPIRLSVVSRDQLHRDDLMYAQWRIAILCTMVVLSILAVGFWLGVGEYSFLFLALLMLCAAIFIASMGGEVRVLGGFAERLMNPQSVRLVGCLGIVFTNLFVSMYLDLAQNLPRINRMLIGLAAFAAALGFANLFFDRPIMAQTGNVALIVSAVLIFVAGIMMGVRRSRPSLFLMAAWLPLLVVTILRGLQMNGVGFEDLDWVDYAHPVSFAVAGLALTFGISDKLLQLRKDRDRFGREADTDELTGGFSRKAILKRLASEIEHAHAADQPLSVAFIDVDHFKRVNDTHGHRVGDLMLQQIGRRIRDQLRAGDSLGRYGGDEFLVVMPSTDDAGAYRVAERLRIAVGELSVPAALSSSPSAETVAIRASLSLGIARLHAGESLEELLARADVALYAGKASGRNRVFGYDAASIQTEKDRI